MVYTIASVSTVAGTPKQVVATRTACGWVIITALASNSGANVYVGGVDPANKAGTKVLASTKNGIIVPKGTSITIPGQSASSYIDLSDIWFDVETSNDSISVTYGLR